MTRLAGLNPEDMNAAQRAVYDEIVTGPRGGVHGPIAQLLHCPELCNHVQRIGTFLRFKGQLSPMHRELAMSIVGRHYSSQYVWVAHVRHARTAKLPEDVIQALIARRRPDFHGDADLECIYDVTEALLKGGALEQGLYDRALKRFCKEGVIELVAIAGQFSLLSMVSNLFDIEPRHSDTAKLPD